MQCMASQQSTRNCPTVETEETAATVRVWCGDQGDAYDDILSTDANEYTLPIKGANESVPHDEHVIISDSIYHSGRYVFEVDGDTEINLIIETSDDESFVDGFTTGEPLHSGIVLNPNSDSDTGNRFCTDIWGGIRLRIEKP